MMGDEMEAGGSEVSQPARPAGRGEAEIRPVPPAPAGGDSYQLGDVSGVGIAIGAGARVSVSGYTADQVGALMEQLGRQFQPRPFDGRCPYVGLEAFQEGDAARFFGREALVDELVRRLESARFVLVAGPSGSGKSSLVRAGVIPQLKRGKLPSSAGWLYATLRPGRDPLGALGRALAGLVGQSGVVKEFQEQSGSDPGLLAQWAEIALGDQPQRRLLLFIDQFEELFTQLTERDEPVRLAFLAQLEGAVAVEGGRTIVVLCMRSDFIGQCAVYPELNKRLNQQFLQVGEMSPDELVSAIARPALEAGLRIDPELVAQVLSDMRDQPGALPLMQFALTDLFQAEQAKGGVIALSLAGYMGRGGLRTALQRHADAAFDKLDDAEKELARNIFKGLVQPGLGAVDTARTARFDELAPQGADPQAVETLIRELADARLVTTEEVGAGAGRLVVAPTVRLAHERLLEAWPWLRRLVDENREAISLQNEIQQDALRWESSGKDESYLYSGARLETARERLDEKKISLSGLGAEFVQAGARRKLALEEADREEQRQKLEDAQRLAEAERLRAEDQKLAAGRIRKWAIGLAVIAVIALIAGMMAYNGQRSATSQRQTAVYNAQVADANAATATYALGESQARGTAVMEQAATATHALGLSQQRGTEAAQQKDTAEWEARRAWANQLITQAREIFENGGAPVLLASQAVNIHLLAGEPPLPAALETLRAALREPIPSLLIENRWISPFSTVFSPGGRWLASSGVGENDTTIQLTDLKDLAAEPVGLHGPSVSETAYLFFSPDGRWLASPGEDGSLFVWDTSKLEQQPAILKRVQDGIPIPTFSPDGRFLASADGDQALIWDLQNLEAGPTSLKAGQTLHDLLAFSPDGRYLAAVLTDNSILYWDIEERDSITLGLEGQSFFSYFDAYIGFSYVYDGRYLVACDGYSAGVWDTQDLAAAPQVLGGRADAGYTLVRGDDTAYLIEGRADANNLIWNLRYPTLDPEQYQGEIPNPAPTSPDGRWQAASTINGEIWLKDLEQPEAEPYTLRGHQYAPSVLKFSPDSHWLVSGSDEGILQLWNLHDLGFDPITLDRFSFPISELVFSPGGRWLAGGQRGSSAGVISLWDMQAAQPSWVLTPLLQHNGAAWPLGFSEDGRWLASASLDGEAKIWDLDYPGKKPTILDLGSLPDPATTLLRVSISPDFRWLARSDEQSNVLIWDVQKPEAEPVVLRGQSGDIIAGDIVALQFSPGGRWLASSNNHHTIFLWDTQDLAADPVILQGPERGAPRMAFSPDGKWLAYEGKKDGDIRGSYIWLIDLQHPDSEPVRLPLEPRTPLASLVFSPSGRWLAANYDGQIHLWDMQNSQERVVNFTGNAFGLLFSPDERWLVRPVVEEEAGGTLNSEIRMWDLTSSEPEATILYNQIGQIISLAFSPDGRWLVASSSDGAVRLWHVRPEELVELSCRAGGRNFTQEEWQQYFPGKPYRETCPQWPEGE